MKKYIFLNWKCYPLSWKEAGKLLLPLRNKEFLKRYKLIICSPFIFLEKIKKDSKIDVCAQNCFWETKGGPFTGEISPLMLKNINCNYVILGHSERKRLFNETEEIIRKKLKAALSAKLNVLLFFGESFRESKKEIIRQLNVILKGIGKKDLRQILFVYEPAFAVSTQGGKPLDSEEVEEKQMLVRKYLNNRFSLKPVILYGGSVDKGNIRSYLKETGIDGVVIGQASVNLKKIEKVIKVSLSS